MRRTTNIATVLVAALVMSLCAAQISIPLEKRNIQTDATGYAQETFYTFDLEILGEHPQKLTSIADLQQVTSFVVDSTCTNCFSASADKTEFFSCGNSCGTETSDDPSVKLVGGKVRVNKHNTISKEGQIGEQKVNLKSLVDITSLKDSNFVATEKLYFDQIKAGLGFCADTGKDANTPLSQIFSANNISPREFSLYFNSEMGRLIIGKPEDFFGQGGKVFKAITDETDQTSSWTVKVGPTLKVGDAPLISTQSDDPPSSDPEALTQASLDSTTKFTVVPQTVYDRLDRTLFQHNNCAEDAPRSTICDCSGSWVPIDINLIVDYTVKSFEKNIEKFTLESANYLEEITSGNNSGRCLLLIKSKEGVTDQDFTLGTSFLSKYYANFNLDEQTITLSESKGIVPNALHLDNNYRLPFVIAGSILALALVGGLFLILKSTKAPSDADVFNASHIGKSRVQPSPATTISYLVRSPRQIESLQQISQYVKVQGPGGSPIHARVINSPQRNLIYSQAQPQVQQYYQQ